MPSLRRRQQVGVAHDAPCTVGLLAQDRQRAARTRERIASGTRADAHVELGPAVGEITAGHDLPHPSGRVDAVRGQLRVVAYEDVVVDDPRPAAVQRIAAVREGAADVGRR